MTQSENLPETHVFFTRQRARMARHVGLALLVIIVTGASYPVVWLLAPVTGQVIDRSDGRPIEGAVVLGSWQLEWSAQVGQLAAMESQSDALGRFSLNPWMLRTWFGLGHLADNQPEIWIIRQGYVPYRIRNDCCGSIPPRFFVRMAPVIAALETAVPPAAARAQDDLSMELLGAFHKTPCNWTRMTHARAEIKAIRRALLAAGASMGSEFDFDSAQCTSGATTGQRK